MKILINLGFNLTDIIIRKKLKCLKSGKIGEIAGTKVIFTESKWHSFKRKKCYIKKHMLS